MSTRTTLAICNVIVASLLLCACGAAGSGPTTIKGAGATAPYLVYEKWLTEFNKEFRDVVVAYSPSGSGDGIRQLEAGTVDFAASDVPLSDAEIERLGKQVFYFPTVTGAIVPIFNVPGVTQYLQFSGDSLSGIFLGTIRNWKLGVGRCGTLKARGQMASAAEIAHASGTASEFLNPSPARSCHAQVDQHSPGCRVAALLEQPSSPAPYRAENRCTRAERCACRT